MQECTTQIQYLKQVQQPSQHCTTEISNGGLSDQLVIPKNEK